MTEYVVGSHGPCRMATGTYTGDGTVSQAITGIGFQVRFIVIARLWTEAYSGTDATSGFTMESQTVGFANMGLMRYSYDDRIKTLDADGFTVSDDGSDSDPNKDGQDYCYTVWG